jgi:5-methylthioadenosine/S-adenosylhomocysteine deaminase
MLDGQERNLLLRGDIVTPDGIARDRYVLCRDGEIAEISRRHPPRTDGIPLLETRRGDWIFPGLINLHTHATYNFLPLWASPEAPFSNRHEWRQNPAYKSEVGGFARDFAKREGMREIISVFGELQAIAGGTAVMQEDFALDSEKKLGGLLLCRDTASPEDFGLPADKVIQSVVDFFRPGPGGAPSPVIDSIAAYRKARDESRLVAAIVHLAEGRSGFGSNRGVDPYSRAEFEAFMALPEMQDPEAVRRAPLSLVHGCGIDPHDGAHLDFLRQRNISLVWSPVSNLLLYADTLDVEAYLAAGINVALGSDWAPSGSKHVWDEARFARAYFDAIGSPVPDALIFEMTTVNAARCLGMDHIGRIREGALADFFILRSPIETDNPYEVFLGTDDKDVLATIIAGRAIYGDRALLADFATGLQQLPTLEGSAVRNKVVRLPAQLDFDVDGQVGRMERELKAFDPPVKRSNLLASSDKPYRRRIQKLRAELQHYGWGVRQWRHDGPSATPGRVPVEPASVQVRLGYRNRALPFAGFVERLGGLFIPVTTTLQAPLGMTACLQAVLPEARPEAVPDQIALVFFESEAARARLVDSPAGRACQALDETLFDLARRRGLDLPAPFSGTLAAGAPVHLFAGKADWQRGTTELFVGTRPEAMSAEAFLAALGGAADSLRTAPPAGLDGAIVVAENDYVLWWQHWGGAPDPAGAVAARLAGVANHLLDTMARPAKAAPLFWPSAGVAIAPGELINLIFERRAATPW